MNDLPEPVDLRPAAQQLAALIADVRDDQLELPTPCPDFDVALLLGHIDDLSRAFTWAATKEFPPDSGGPPPAPRRVSGDWRTRIGDQLRELGAAWADPGAWQGMTKAGGLDMPGPIGGIVAVDEVVVHGWDLARATGQPFEPDDAAIAAAAGFASMFGDDDRGDAFAPAVDVPADASPLDRLVGAVGRDPGWRPTA